MQTTTAQAEMCRMMAHYIRVATRRVDDTLFMIVLDQSLVQSTTTDIRDEKSAEDDDEEDELITTFTAETVAAIQSKRAIANSSSLLNPVSGLRCMSFCLNVHHVVV